MSAEFVLRRVRWGMTPGDVEAAEGPQSQLLDDGSLAYTVELAGSAATLFYSFALGELASAFYLFDDVNDVFDVATHDRLLNLLTEKYGEPQTDIDRHTPYRIAFPETFGELAKVVARGELEITSVWTTDTSRIILALREDKSHYNVFVALSYVSLEAPHPDYSADIDML